MPKGSTRDTAVELVERKTADRVKGTILYYCRKMGSCPIGWNWKCAHQPWSLGFNFTVVTHKEEEKHENNKPESNIYIKSAIIYNTLKLVNLMTRNLIKLRSEIIYNTLTIIWWFCYNKLYIYICWTEVTYFIGSVWVIIILGKTSYLGFKWVFWIRMRFHWEKKKR